jgi:YD repeat-containing protein
MRQAVALGGLTARTALYATRIVDRNGNAADVSYLGAGRPEIAGVATSEGHQVVFSYHALGVNESVRRISTITSVDAQSGNRVYTYGYTAAGGTASGSQLTSVTRPDGLQWQYRYNADLASSGIPGGFHLRGVTHPEGGTVAYSYGSSSSDYVNFDAFSNTTAANRTSVVRSKTSGDGGNWTFSYLPGAIGSYDTTTVSTPSGTIVYRHVGPNYASAGSLWMVGLLMQKQIGALQTETYSWTPQQVSPQQLKRPGLWQATRLDPVVSAPLLSSRTITRDGASYATTFSDFDAFGNPRSVQESGTGGGARTTALTYYANTSLWIIKQVKDQTVLGGVQILRGLDGVGNLLSVTQDGVTTSYSRFPDGSISQATFPRNLVHNYSSYKRGIARSESQPEGITVGRTVSDSGNVLSEVNGRGFLTGYLYDGLNRLTRIAPPRGDVTVIGYGQTSKTATRGPLTETTVYDGFGRPASITLGGVLRTYQHDPLGRMTFASNPAASIGTSYQYDILDRLRQVFNADNTRQVISFGAGSRVVTDERLKATTYSYRAYGDPGEQFLMSISAPEPSASVGISRNTKNLIASISQGGFTRTYGYDTRGFLTSVVNPETGTTVYGRDDADNLTSRSVGSSGQTIYGYDGQNRLRTIAYPAGTPSVTKTYTRTHKLESVTSSTAVRSFGYDANDNLTNESLTTDGLLFQLIYGYNGNDQLSSLTYPRSNRLVAYDPDALGRPRQVSGFISSVGYHPSGQLSQIGYANGTTSTYGQNNRLWPSSFHTSKGAVGYLRSTYGYDGVGNLTSVVDSVDDGFNRLLDYDAINRLSVAAGPWGAGALTYDGAGNLRSQSLGNWSLSYNYDSANRLGGVTGSRTATYSYNLYGSVVGAGGRTYVYDDAPNMTCANCNDAATATQFQYDGLNMRVSAQKGGVKTYEFYSFNGQLLTEYTPALGNRLAEHIYLGGRRVASAGPAPTSIALPASTLNIVVGQSVSLTASVSGGTSPTGTVRFFDGSTLLGASSVVAGQASLATTFQAIGTRTLTAVYSGDAANLGSTTTAVANVLSATAISGPAGGAGYTAVAGRSATLGATISGQSPTGTVSFYVGSTLLGTAQLSGGTGFITTTFSTPGTYNVTITYSGDANNAPSSATVTLNVRIPPEQLVPILQLLLED